MRAKLSYKSKRNIVIALIIMVLFAASVTTTYFFIKGNQDSSAAFTGNDSQTSENTPVQGSTEGENNPDENGEVVVPNVNDNNEGNATTPDENQTTARPNTQIGQNGTTTTQTTGNVPNQEYVTERIETEEVLVSESYAVAWAPLAIQANTTTSGRSIVRPEITATKTVDKQEAKVGEELVYTITATNSGKEDGATIVKDTIPTGTTFVEGSIKVNGEDSTYTAEDLANGITINVTKNGGASTVSFIVVINKENNNEVVKTVKNIATVGEEETEEVETKVANITTVKESIASKEVLHELDTITYKLTSTNNGDGKGTVKVADQVPAGTTLVGNITLTGDDKEYTEQELNNGIDVTLLPGEEKTITFTVKINPFSAEKIEVKNEVATQDETPVPGTTDEVEKEYKTVSVSKSFTDKENVDGKRPSVVTVGLFVNENEEPINTVELNADNNWEYTFEKLDKYNENEEENNYAVKEINVDENYNDTYEVTTAGDNKTVEITNTLKYENVKTSVTVKKDWQDDGNKAGVRPDSVNFTLVAGGKDIETKPANKDNWTVVFDNLNKYTEAGEEIVYTVKEATVTNYKEPVVSGIENGKITVTNTIDYTSIKTSITVEKDWQDDGNKAGVRPDSVNFTLVAGGKDIETKPANKDNWTVVFDNLNKYTEAGEEIVYTVKEATVTNYKEPVVSGIENGKITVTNTIDYTSIKTSITVEKDWQDDGNKAGVRPDSVNFTLVAGGKDIETKTANKDNWTVVFDNLNKYTEAGEEIDYTVRETQVNNYKTPVVSDTVNGKVTVTNTIDYTKITTSVSARKVWDDNGNVEERPESVTFTLVADKDVEMPEETTKTITSANWNEVVTFDNLHKYTTTGEKVTYTINESNVPHYTRIADGKDEDGTIVITNKIDYTSITTSVSARKVWEDNENATGVRPTSVTFTLVADKAVTMPEVTTKTITSTNWNEVVTFDNLYKYTTTGEKVTYTINEAEVPHYTRKADTADENGTIVITNKIDYTTITTDVDVVKEATQVITKNGETANVTRENGKVTSYITNENVGDVIRYTITATNNSNVAIKNVNISDKTHNVKVVKVEKGNIENNTFTATYTYNVPTENNEIITANSNLLSVLPENVERTLAVGESYRVTVDYTIDSISGDTINNTAKITATVDGMPDIDEEDPEEVPVMNTDPTITKTSIKYDGKDITSETKVEVGKTVTYEIEVENKGYKKLEKVSVTDSRRVNVISIEKVVNGQRTPSGLTRKGNNLLGKDTLEAGEKYIITVTYTLKSEDGIINEEDKVDGDKLINIATLSYGEDGKKQDDDVLNKYKEAKITKTKTSQVIGKDGKIKEDNMVDAGDIIEYTITVRNTGNVSKKDVIVKDSMLLKNITDKKVTMNSGIKVESDKGYKETETLENLTTNGIKLDVDNGETYTITFSVKVGDLLPGKEIINVLDDGQEDEKVQNDVEASITLTRKTVNPQNTVIVIDLSLSMAQDVEEYDKTHPKYGLKDPMADSYEGTRWYALTQALDTFLNTYMDGNNKVTIIGYNKTALSKPLIENATDIEKAKASYANVLTPEQFKTTIDEESKHTNINSDVDHLIGKDCSDSKNNARYFTDTGTKLGSGTNVDDGLRKAMNSIEGNAEGAHVILMTDGKANKCGTSGTTNGTINDAKGSANNIKNAGATLYTVAFTKDAVDDLSIISSKGKNYSADNIEELKLQFKGLSETISSQTINGKTSSGKLTLDTKFNIDTEKVANVEVVIPTKNGDVKVEFKSWNEFAEYYNESTRTIDVTALASQNGVAGITGNVQITINVNN